LLKSLICSGALTTHDVLPMFKFLTSVKTARSSSKNWFFETIKRLDRYKRMPESADNMEEPGTTRFANLSSPIFWRITAGVFASILLIEAALLLFSWHTEQKRQLNGLDDSIKAVTTLLDPINPIPQLDQLIKAESTVSKHRIVGYLYRTSTGERYASGNSVDLEKEVFAGKPRLYSSSKGVYSTYLSQALLSTDANELWLRVDATWISAYMKNYIWRILVMILLISAFVTGACLVFLNPLLIKPRC